MRCRTMFTGIVEELGTIVGCDGGKIRIGCHVLDVCTCGYVGDPALSVPAASVGVT